MHLSSGCLRTCPHNAAGVSAKSCETSRVRALEHAGATSTELREMYGHRVNRKVVERLHRLWDLPLRRVRRPRPSAIRRAIGTAGARAKLLSRHHKAEISALEILYPGLRFAGGVRKAWLIPLLDDGDQLRSGLRGQGTGELRTGARGWTAAEWTLRRYRDSPEGVIVHQDRDPVFTGYAWTGRLLGAGLRLSSALRGAKRQPRRWRASSAVSRCRTDP